MQQFEPIRINLHKIIPKRNDTVSKIKSTIKGTNKRVLHFISALHLGTYTLILLNKLC